MAIATIPDEAVGGNSFRRQPRLGAWLFMAPLILWLLLFVVAPTLMLVVISFCERDGLGRVVYTFTLENYTRAFSLDWLRVLLLSVWYAFLTTVICLAVGFPAAFFIGRAPEKVRQLLMMLVMIPFWTSFLIRTYAWITILSEQGLVNGVLIGSGIIHSPLPLLYTPFAIVLGLVYNYLPFMILPIYTSVEKLDGAVVEAAFDLGAGPLRAFTRVIVPLTSAGIAAGVLLVFVPALGLYAINDILGGGKVDMLGNIIENQFKGSARNWPFGAALGTVLLVAFAATHWLSGRRRI